MKRQLGTRQGTVLSIAPDFDAPLEDFKEYSEGDFQRSQKTGSTYSPNILEVTPNVSLPIAGSQPNQTIDNEGCAMSRVTEKLTHETKNFTSGITCPTPDCFGPTAVIKTKQPKGYTTRRCVCGRCQLRFTTSERLAGGVDEADLIEAQQRLAEWKATHSTTEGA